MLNRDESVDTIPIAVFGDQPICWQLQCQLEFLGCLIRPINSLTEINEQTTAALWLCGSGDQLRHWLADCCTALPTILHLTDHDANLLAHSQGVAITSAPLSLGQAIKTLEWIRLRQQPPAQADDTLIGEHPSMLILKDLIAKVAKADASVLILGETGSGKEVVARAIHQASARGDQPFIAVNCGAIPGDLLESELFGHEKGAFTGAFTARSGRFELAGDGTIFLDEIGDMPLSMQVKLLRVLQERTFERVGSNKLLVTNARIISATHRDLDDAVASGTFREDLFFRLNVFPLRIPPLRERGSDLPLLIAQLEQRLRAQGAEPSYLTPGVIAQLQRHPWPGNVRELANLIEQLSIMYPATMIDLHQLPPRFRPPQLVEPVLPEHTSNVEGTTDSDPPTVLPEGTELREYLNELECSMIRSALEENHHVVARAARRLGMRRTTLVERMRKFGLERSDSGTAPKF